MDEKNENSLMVFGIYDYFTLGFLLCVSILIGLYSAIFKKDNTIEAYLFGNRKLKVLPVAASIMASEIASTSILSLPTEVYLYGSNMFYIVLANISCSIIIYFVILPIFHNLQITTIYEYLERRFNRSVRTLCSFFFILQIIFSIPVLLCVASLSLSLATGFNFYSVTIIAAAVTTFYTAILNHLPPEYNIPAIKVKAASSRSTSFLFPDWMLRSKESPESGGIRAVVWADTIQALFMLVGVIAVAVKGIMDVGSFNEVWMRNVKSSRLEPPNLHLDFTEKYSFWGWTIGGGFSWIVHGSLNQGIAQRYLSVPSLSSARKCLMSSKIISVFYFTVCTVIGMVLAAKYEDCDPLQSNKIVARDQMASFFIMNSLRNILGLPGLIMAAIVSASISTVSTQLNSVAAIVLNDYYKTFINKNISEKTSNIVLKLTVVILGIVVTLVSFFVKVFGSAIQAYFVFMGAVNGLVLGTFAIGFFLPMIKSKPTLLGGIVGFAVMVWIATGMNIATVSGRYIAETKPLSVHGCETNITITERIQDNEEVFVLYRISPLWYTPIGMLVTVTVSCFLSIFMERNDVSKMDRKVLTPLIHRFLPEKTPLVDTEMSLLKEQNTINN